MGTYSKNIFQGKIEKIYDPRYGTGSKGDWELVAFSVKARFFRTFQLWHNVDDFLNNFQVGDEVIVYANEVPNKTKDKAGNEVWGYSYNVEKIEHAPVKQESIKESHNSYKQKEPQEPQIEYYEPSKSEYGITDDDLPF